MGALHGETGVRHQQAQLVLFARQRGQQYPRCLPALQRGTDRLPQQSSYLFGVEMLLEHFNPPRHPRCADRRIQWRDQFLDETP